MRNFKETEKNFLDFVSSWSHRNWKTIEADPVRWGGQVSRCGGGFWRVHRRVFRDWQGLSHVFIFHWLWVVRSLLLQSQSDTQQRVRQQVTGFSYNSPEMSWDISVMKQQRQIYPRSHTQRATRISMRLSVVQPSEPLLFLVAGTSLREDFLSWLPLLTWVPSKVYRTQVRMFSEEKKNISKLLWRGSGVPGLRTDRRSLLRQVDGVSVEGPPQGEGEDRGHWPADQLHQRGETDLRQDREGPPSPRVQETAREPHPSHKRHRFGPFGCREGRETGGKVVRVSTCNNSAQFLCLPSLIPPGDISSSELKLIAGWGKTKYEDKPSHLQYGETLISIHSPHLSLSSPNHLGQSNGLPL